jgi:hypothetical protein
LPLEVGQVIERGERPLLGEDVGCCRPQAGLDRPGELNAKVKR